MTPDGTTATQAVRGVHEAIAANAAYLWRTQRLLDQLIVKACPGPHRFVQHRDRKAAWCDVCRYTQQGQRIKEAL